MYEFTETNSPMLFVGSRVCRIVVAETQSAIIMVSARPSAA